MKLAYEKPEIALERYQAVDILTFSLGDILPTTPEEPKDPDLNDDDVFTPV